MRRKFSCQRTQESTVGAPPALAIVTEETETGFLASDSGHIPFFRSW